MEINNDLHNYVITFDNVMPKNILETFTKYCKQLEYGDAHIIFSDKKNIIDPIVRKTLTYSMIDVKTNSLTKVHWCNFLTYTFKILVKDYFNFTKLPNNVEQIIDIQILKYEKGGHYVFHTDDSRSAHRILSCIFFTNDDYEGGNLLFKYPFKKDIVKIEKKSNRMVIFPSNILYSHSVEPVISGERLSVVSWVL
tara:strand:+ start:1845 stop:2429 length:585 start_codon:yes stop_codon:yes gene_type:complete